MGGPSLRLPHVVLQPAVILWEKEAHYGWSFIKTAPCFVAACCYPVKERGTSWEGPH